MEPRRDGQVSRGNRGQTGVDFIVGVGIFLLTVGFVVAFVPGMLSPFTEESTGRLVADRIADDLVADTLATGPGSDTLDPERTWAFFNRTTVPASLALPAGFHLNVTIEGTTPMTMGESLPTAGASVATVSRVAALEGESVTVVVRLW